MANEADVAEAGDIPAEAGGPAASGDNATDATDALNAPNANAGESASEPENETDRPAYDSAQQRELSAATDANAAIHAQLMDARAAFRSDPDYTSLAQRWDEASRKIVDDGVARIANPGLRFEVRDAAETALAQEAASIQDQAFRAAADAHAAYRRDYLQDLLSHTGPEANDPLLAGATDAYQATIDDAVSRGYVTSGAALAEKRSAALALCSAHYAAMARTDPARAVDELESPHCPHPVAQFLPADARDGLIAQAKANQEAQRIDAARAPLLRAQQAQRASDASEAAILKDLLGPNPTVTASAIANDATLSPQARTRLIATAARATQPDPQLTSNESGRTYPTIRPTLPFPWTPEWEENARRG